MNEIYTEADLMPESTIPSGTIVTENDLLPVGAVPEVKVPVQGKESIPVSAAKDLLNVTSGVAGMVNQGVMDWVNVLNPSKQNTIYKFAKGIKDEYDRGTLSEDAWNTAKSFVEPILSDLGAVGGDIIKGEPGAALEKVARRPFTYGMDIASLIQPVAKGAGATAKYGASLSFGPSAKNIAARIASSKVIQSARPYELISRDIPSAMKILEGKISTADAKAWSTLSKNPDLGYPMQEVVGMIDDTKAKIVGKAIGQADKAAVNVLDGIKSDLMAAYKGKKTEILGPTGQPLSDVYGGEKISAADLKTMLQKLDKNIDYDTPLSDTANRALKDLRHTADDVLKVDNPEYGSAMEPVRDLIKNLERSKKVLGVKKVMGEYIIPDTTTRKISSLNKSFKDLEIAQLKQFGKETGLDIPAESKNFAIQDAFNKPTTNGARRAVAGTIIGGAIGHATGSTTTGAAIGTAIGGGLDIYGGRILAPALDTLSAPIKFIGKNIEGITPKALGAGVVSTVARSTESEPK